MRIPNVTSSSLNCINAPLKWCLSIHIESISDSAAVPDTNRKQANAVQ